MSSRPDPESQRKAYTYSKPNIMYYLCTLSILYINITFTITPLHNCEQNWSLVLLGCSPEKKNDFKDSSFVSVYVVVYL